MRAARRPGPPGPCTSGERSVSPARSFVWKLQTGLLPSTLTSCRGTRRSSASGRSPSYPDLLRLWCWSLFASGVPRLRKRRVDLVHDLFVGVVPEHDRLRRTPGAAEAVPLAERRIHLGLLAVSRLAPADRPVGAGRHARSARDAAGLRDVADGSRGDDRVM